jgi:hypothetical protein
MQLDAGKLKEIIQQMIKDHKFSPQQVMEIVLN